MRAVGVQRVMARRLIALLLMIASSGAPLYAQAPSATPSAAAPPARIAMTRETAERLRADLEKAWPGVEGAARNWQRLSVTPRDSRRVSPAYDVKSYVLPQDAQARFESRRKEAQLQFDGGDWPGAILLYIDMIKHSNGVVQRLNELSRYWIWTVTHERRMKRWVKTVKANRLANPAGPQIEDLARTLENQIRAQQFGEPAARIMAQIDATYKQAVIDARTAAPGGVLRDDPERQTPRVACTDATPDIAATAYELIASPARLDPRHSKPTEGYYPDVARYNNIQGIAMVRAMISPSGCVVYAEIAESSLSELLDDAALEWTVDAATFAPAQGRNQGAVPMLIEFQVRFVLR